MPCVGYTLYEVFCFKLAYNKSVQLINNDDMLNIEVFVFWILKEPIFLHLNWKRCLLSE